VILAIDTSTMQVGVALGEGHGKEVRGTVRLVGERRHAEQLAPAIRALTEWTGVPLAALDAIAVGVGPGLFTGLRVGVTTANVMAQALRIPVIGVPGLDLVAHPLRHSARTIVAVLDARRGEVFHARYRPVADGVVRESEYAVSTVDVLVRDLAALDEDMLLAGDGVARYEAELSAPARAELAGADFAEPSVSALVELASSQLSGETACVPVTPMYLRESDAELSWVGKRTAGPMGDPVAAPVP
jgi:tRNA threonylcarbamoyladenosine biosynthesis protein TsaB